MDAALYTFAAHRGLPFATPMGEAGMSRALDLLISGLPIPTPEVIDLGAGACELPIRLAERVGARVTAVELCPRFAAVARERIAQRLVNRATAGGVTVHEGDAGRFRATIPDRAYDAAICVGSASALGGFSKAAQILARITRPGGLVLLGDSCWLGAPPKPYLDAMNLHDEDHLAAPMQLEAAEDAGLVALWFVQASERDRDEYEWAKARAIDAFCKDRPEPEARAMLDHARDQRTAYVRFGRDALGFALGLYRVADIRPIGTVEG